MCQQLLLASLATGLVVVLLTANSNNRGNGKAANERANKIVIMVIKTVKIAICHDIVVLVRARVHDNMAISWNEHPFALRTTSGDFNCSNDIGSRCCF